MPRRKRTASFGPLPAFVAFVSLLALSALSALSAVSPAPARAEGYAVSGVVAAAGGGEPLAGVHVASGDGAETTTDAGGRFTIRVRAGGATRLSFTLRGYRPVAREVDSNTSALLILMAK
ncbi:MAG: carboxypeptidase regulatory-like domain-containing protein [Desulfovibrionaceae bacterium]